MTNFLIFRKILLIVFHRTKQRFFIKMFANLKTSVTNRFPFTMILEAPLAAVLVFLWEGGERSQPAVAAPSQGLCPV